MWKSRSVFCAGFSKQLVEIIHAQAPRPNLTIAAFRSLCGPKNSLPNTGTKYAHDGFLGGYVAASRPTHLRKTRSILLSLADDKRPFLTAQHDR
jgi:hypothetical protein